MAYKEFSISKKSESFYSFAYWAQNTIPGETPTERYARAHDAAVANYSIATRAIGQYEQGQPPEHYSVYTIIYRMPVSFDTSVIVSGAPIEAAYLRMYVTNDGSTTDFDIVVQNGQPTYPHSPAMLADYDALHYSGNGGSYNTASISSTPMYINITLDATGIGWINKGVDALTKFCIRSSRDISATKPTMNVAEYIGSSSTALYLRVRVTLSIPTAVTDDYTNKGASAATFNGEITDSGYWLDGYGFEWKQGLEGEVSSITVGGDRATGLVFSYHKTGLSGTIYYRAWGNNGAGKGHGEWKEISFAAVTTQAASDIGIEHAKGHGTANGEDITERGFEIKTAFAGTLGDYLFHRIAGFVSIDVVNSSMGYWEGYVTKTKRYVGTFEEGAFVGDLGRFPTAVFSDQLFAGETYSYRAYAVIDGETYYGGYLPFTTNTYPPGEGPDNVISASVPIVEPVVDEVFSPFPPGDPSYNIPPFGLPEYSLDFPSWTFPAWGFPPFGYAPWEYPPWAISPWGSPPWDYPPFTYNPWEFPDVVLPPWEDPVFDWSPEPGVDPEITFGKTFSAFIRKLDTKKDWKTLREKCIVYQENMNQFALTINHNTLVLKGLVNDIIKYIDGDVYPSDLELVNSCQQLTPLYLEPISPDGFKDIINDFRLKDVCNVYNLNTNFRKMINSLNSLYESDYSVKPISYNTSEYIDIRPTAKRMILQLEDMSKKSEGVRELVTLNVKRIFLYI